MDVARTFFQQRELSPADVVELVGGIYQQSLRSSPYLRRGNFESLHRSDLQRLFELYDERFFQGRCRQLLGDTPLEFRISRRMTRAGGKTTRSEFRGQDGGVMRCHYEIAVSATLLFQTFRDVERPVTTAGVVCRDRLEALQRIFEHELVHLVEMLLWTRSNCAATRFQSISSRFFAHREHTHQLVTPREHAAEKFGIRPGDQVTFRFEGRHFLGRVNRITRRATVLVEDPRGERYSDGRRYAKFYVPLAQLARVR